jgi:hypothetical protein
MTLPFRRRHHDNEGSHDRARTLVGEAMLEPLGSADAAWLEGHLASCAECRMDRDAYLTDRQLLRTLRDASPEPPRDLWARTAAAIEREQARRPRRAVGRGAQGPAFGAQDPGREEPAVAGRLRLPPLRSPVPLGVLSGALVVLLLVATSVVIPGGLLNRPNGNPGAIATPLAVSADRLSWIQGTADGQYQLMFASVDRVCPDARAGCAPLEDSRQPALTFGEAPQAIVISPSDGQVVVIGAPGGADAGNVLVVTVPTPVPTLASTASVSPGAETSGSPTASASAGASPPVEASPAASAELPRAIATGVSVVGDAAYSPDGIWFAFSARPVDQASGADLYVWKVGEPSATAVTTDHETYFSSWFGARILASRPHGGTVAGRGAVTSPAPAARAAASPAPASAAAAPAVASPATSPGQGSPAAESAPAAAEGHPSSFLFDPATQAVTDLAGGAIWLPAIDAGGRFVVYWSGTVVADHSARGWSPATGSLVLNGWSSALGPLPSASPASSPAASAGASRAPAETEPPGSSEPTPTAGSPEASAATGSAGGTLLANASRRGGVKAGSGPLAAPVALPSGAAGIGPIGSPEDLLAGPIADFQVSFDPTGTRLAVWVADPANPAVGTIRLIVLDLQAGNLDPRVAPLPGVPAMRGFSMDQGRLAWVSPPGQDGEESTVHVLAWSKDTFGEVRTIPATQLFVVR